MNDKTKRYLITAIKFALSIGILIYLFNKARNEPEFENFFSTPKKWSWIALAVLTCIGAHVLGFVRWKIMVNALGLPFSLFDAIRIGFIGTFFNLFAFGVIGGDTLRAFYVTRQLKERTSEAILSVVADRVIGLLTMFTVASTAFLCMNMSSLETQNSQDLTNINFICRFVLLFTVLGYAGMLTVFCAPWLTKTKWYQALMKIPKAGAILEKLTEIALVYRSRPGAVAMSFILSAGVNICFLLTIYSLAAGLTKSYPTIPNHFVIEPIAMVANAVPLPGGVGGMEWAMSFLYEAFGSSAGVIVGFAFRFCILSVSAIGAAFWFVNKSEVSDAMEASHTNGEQQ